MPGTMRAYIQPLVWTFLLDHGIDRLPVDIWQIPQRNNWLLYTYRDFAKTAHPSFWGKIDGSVPGFVFWSGRSRTYVICYDDTIPIDYQRWVITHEIAHIVCGHLRRRTMHTYSGSTLLEAEAEGFTRRVLCPSIVLHDCQLLEPEEIQRVCGIPPDKAARKSKHIKEIELLNLYHIHPLEDAVEQQFTSFIANYNLYKMRYIQKKTALVLQHQDGL